MHLVRAWHAWETEKGSQTCMQRWSPLVAWEIDWKGRVSGASGRMRSRFTQRCQGADASCGRSRTWRRGRRQWLVVISLSCQTHRQAGQTTAHGPFLSLHHHLPCTALSASFSLPLSAPPTVSARTASRFVSLLLFPTPCPLFSPSGLLPPVATAAFLSTLSFPSRLCSTPCAVSSSGGHAVER